MKKKTWALVVILMSFAAIILGTNYYIEFKFPSLGSEDDTDRYGRYD